MCYTEFFVHQQEHLMDFIVRQKIFWSDDDENILRAIKEGFIQTHQAMWKELGKTLDLRDRYIHKKRGCVHYQ